MTECNYCDERAVAQCRAAFADGFGRIVQSAGESTRRQACEHHVGRAIGGLMLHGASFVVVRVHD